MSAIHQIRKRKFYPIQPIVKKNSTLKKKKRSLSHTLIIFGVAYFYSCLTDVREEAFFLFFFLQFQKNVRSNKENGMGEASHVTRR